MSLRIAPLVALLATAAHHHPAAGFAPPPPSTTTTTSTSTSSITISQQRTPSSSALHMSSIIIPHHAASSSEESYPRLLTNASLCANSDSCPIESAEMYLREIVHVQSGCAAGTMSGNEVCEDVAGVAGVVAELRRKIGEGAEREVRTFWDYRQDELETLASASLSSATSPLTAPLKPAYLAIAALYVIAIISIVQQPHAAMDVSSSSSGVVPFTAQEMWWAVRDGYAGDLASHLFRNGGLAVVDNDVAYAVGNSLTPQELLWSIQDVYAMSDTLFSSSGAAVVEGGVESVPFTPQEAWWAIRGGYGGDMLGHWFRNGGLSL